VVRPARFCAAARLRRQVPLRRRCPPRARLDAGEAQDEDEIIVRRDAVGALEAAVEAAVHEDVLAVAAEERGFGRHGAAAVGGAVAGRAPVDVA